MWPSSTLRNLDLQGCVPIHSNEPGPVFPLVANNDVIVAIVQEFRAMYRLLVPEIPFALCVHDVLGYVQSDFAIDDSSSLVVELVGAVHNTDLVAINLALPVRACVISVFRLIR